MDDMPVGVLDGGQLYYIQPDHLGTPRTVIDPTRNVAVWRWDSKGEAFGSTSPEQDADGDGISLIFNARLPGQRYDGTADLNYNYFRDYEAGTGRYVQSDPIGFAGGLSTYGYADGDALTRIDPLGLEGFGPWNSPETLRAWGRRDAQRVGAAYSLLEEWRLWGHRNFPGERNSAMRHCTVSCITGRKIGTPAARAAGVGNELIGFVRWDIRMLGSRIRGNTPWAFQWGDLSSNEHGFSQSGDLSCGLSDSELPEECMRRCLQSLVFSSTRNAGMPLPNAYLRDPHK